MLRRIFKGVLRPFYRIWCKLWYAYSVNKDKKRGVDFYTWVDNAGTPEALAGHHTYQATALLYDPPLKKFLRRQNHADDRVVDVGCGKGRMLELFIALGFLKADGLEYSPELAEIARNNMKTLGLPCEIFTEDATLFDGYDVYNWFYLYNPFSRDVMLRFLNRLKESLRRSPRLITILYTNPTCESVFADAGFHMEWIGKGWYRVRLITNEGMAEGVPPKK